MLLDFLECGSKGVCSFRILMRLVPRFRYLSLFDLVLREKNFEDLPRGKLIASFGGSLIVADRPKSRRAH